MIHPSMDFNIYYPITFKIQLMHVKYEHPLGFLLIAQLFLLNPLSHSRKTFGW